MDELKIKAFENAIADICNGTPIASRIKYYVLKDLAQKLLEASELEIQLAMKEAQDAKSVQQDSMGECSEH